MLDLHGYGASIFGGAVLTIEVAVLSLLLALALGLLAALAKLSRQRALRLSATIYTTIIRGVPDLVLMLLIYFGGQMLMNKMTDWLFEHYKIDIFININEFVAGVVTIGFIFGAYMAETFRGAFQSVHAGQIEAAKALGMTQRHIFVRIMFPQMMRHALPGLGNNWQVLLKTTALVSVIGLADMVRLATEAAKTVHEPFTFLVPVAGVYLLLTALSEWGLRCLQIKYDIGVARTKQGYQE